MCAKLTRLFGGLRIDNRHKPLTRCKLHSVDYINDDLPRVQRRYLSIYLYLSLSLYIYIYIRIFTQQHKHIIVPDMICSTLRYAMLHYAMIRHATAKPHHDMLPHAMLWHDIWHTAYDIQHTTRHAVL